MAVNPAYKSEPALTEPERDAQTADPRDRFDDPPKTGLKPAVPGTELPALVYVSVAAAFAWMMIAALIAFGRGREAEFNIAVAAVLMVVFLALPLLIYLTALRHAGRPSAAERPFAVSIETATGELSTAAAWAQIALIPAALAFAATLIGAVYLLFV